MADGTIHNKPSVTLPPSVMDEDELHLDSDMINMELAEDPTPHYESDDLMLCPDEHGEPGGMDCEWHDPVSDMPEEATLDMIQCLNNKTP